MSNAKSAGLNEDRLAYIDRFLTETCGKADVACVSYAGALDILAREKKAAGAAL